MYLPVPGFKPMPSVFLGECVTHFTTVAEKIMNTIGLSHSHNIINLCARLNHKVIKR